MGRNKSRQTPLRLDKRTSRWCAKLGRKVTKGGRSDGHLFRFSSERKESERRKLRIQALWDRLVEAEGDEFTWTTSSLMVAKAIAEGASHVLLPRRRVRGPLGLGFENPESYARYVHRMSSHYPELPFVPEDAEWYQKGADFEAHSVQSQIDKVRTLAEMGYQLPGDSPILLEEPDATVAEALDAYEAHIRNRYLVRPDLEEGSAKKRLSSTGHNYIKRIEDIRQHNAHQLDWPLSQLTQEGCQQMLNVWIDRPLKHDGSRSMTKKFCQEVIKRFMNRNGFFRWVHRSERFRWRKPEDFDELDTTVRKDHSELAAKVVGPRVKTFTVDELCILNQYANPTERFILLCGLNLGFKRMECATLHVGEILLHQMHDEARYIDYPFSKDDSFVRRFRRKTEVYCEWILWPLTVQAMQWVLERRRSQTHIKRGESKGTPIPFSQEALVFLNDSGYAFTKPTKSGNSNNQITNYWGRLRSRIQQDHKDFTNLPHEALRDTAGNWIREKFGGEIAEIFLSHGSPLGSKSLVEVYTNKPFGTLFKALRFLEEKLQPMFDATPQNPFPSELKKGGGGLTLRQKKMIEELSAQQLRVGEIAKRVKCSVATVYRHRSQS